LQQTPKPIKVKDIKDLGRFVASVLSFGQPAYLIHFEHNGKHIYGFLAVYHDYYNLYGLPLFYYYESDKQLNGNYLAVKMSDHEEVMITDGVKPGWLAAPIINLHSKPDFLMI